MEKSRINEILGAYGWEDMGVQKNPVMYSYQDEEKTKRLNYYFTTGTLTIQSVEWRYNKPIAIHKDILTEEDLERCLNGDLSPLRPDTDGRII